MQSTVRYTQCDDYSPADAGSSMEALLGAGLLDFIRPGMTVAVKVNLIAGRAPEKAVNVHPVLIEKLCRMIAARGAQAVVGDSPAGVFTAGFLRSVYRSAGLLPLEEIPGVRLNDDFETMEASFSDAAVMKKFSYTAWLHKADAVIDFCKLKTHAMMGMSGAVKNMFGSVPGTIKPEYHMRFPEEDRFADMLIDLYEYSRPALCIVDAIVCMEGNGPTAGTPRHMGLLLAGTDAYAIDRVCAELTGMNGAEVPTLRAARRRGLEPEKIRLQPTGAREIMEYRIPDFRKAARRSLSFSMKGPAGHLVEKAAAALFATRPQVSPQECVGCHKCADVCPAHAITMKKRGGKILPSVNRRQCIHCFCCQEMCPVGAMKVHHSLPARVMDRAGSHENF